MGVKHATLPAGVDQPGFGGITPTLYAEDHAFTGGAQGAILYRDTGEVYGMNWLTTSTGILVSSGTNQIPTFTATLPTAVQDNITRLGVIASGTVPWANVSKTGSSLADLATRSASDLSSGTLADARFPATLPAISGANLTALNASNIASGSLADGRLSSNVPLKNAANTFTVTGALNVTASGNTALEGLRIRNSSAGTAATGFIGIGNDQSTNSAASIQMFSSGFTTSGPNVADGLRIGCNRPGGLSIGAFDASGAVRLYAGNTLTATFASTLATTFQGSITERGRSVPMGDWTAYTPTWTSLSVGDGTVAARYARVGSTVHFEVLLVFGSSTSVSGSIVVSLPVAMTAAQASRSPANYVALDNNTANRYSGFAVASDEDEILLFTNASPAAVVNATAPFTWAVNDQLFITGTYETV